MADYCDLQDIKTQLVDTLGGTTDTQYDAQLAALITSASRAIDGYVGVEDDYFHISAKDHGSTDGSQTRYFDGTGDYSIRIDDYVDIVSLQVSYGGGVASSDYTTISSSDYFMQPYNAQSKRKPYNTIEIDAYNSSVEPFARYKKSVKITAMFGYSLTPPDDVTQACITMVVRYFMRAKSAFQDAGANPTMGQMFYVRELDPDVKTLLHKYVMENL